MDPLTALSVASSVIQFVDFGSKLLSKSRKLYKSKDGVLRENVDIEDITHDLVTLLQGLRRKLPENRRLGDAPAADSSQHRNDDEALDRLCRRSVEIAGDLLARLGKLKVNQDADMGTHKAADDCDSETASTSLPEIAKPQTSQIWRMFGGDGKRRASGPNFRMWESFRKALEASWNKKEIGAMAATLREYRSEMEFRILVRFRVALNDVAVQQSQASHQLASSTQLILNTFLHSRDSLADELRQQAEKLIELQDSLQNKQSASDQKFDDYLQEDLGAVGSLQNPRPGNTEPAAAEEVEESDAISTEVDGEIRLLMIENGLLKSLAFDTMSDRIDSLEAPYRQTFEWIFDEGAASTNIRWSNFTDWLQTGSGMYWMNGKVGSGKSTLMRYIYENEKTRQALLAWAGSMPSEMAGFFFWNSGDEKQRSQIGLLRSLLFHILQRHRSLLPDVMPAAWAAWAAIASAVTSGMLPLGSPLLPPEPKPWTLVQLRHIFLTLLPRLTAKVKLCLFIDGLDEYEGDHFDLIELLQEASQNANIKFCVSSRPLLAFIQAFGDKPGLRLQDLTRGDIDHYVRSRLYQNSYMIQISKSHASEMNSLVDDIVVKARGVFLWVKLVVRSLLRGLCDYNRISDLRRRVEYLPEDLEALYSHMLKNSDPFYQEQASQVFQIFRLAQTRSPERVMLLDLSWAEVEDNRLAIRAPLQPISNDEIQMRCRVMDARLKSVCAGLLESVESEFTYSYPNHKVAFLHRTVFDWLSKPAVWNGIISHTAGSDFSPNLSMLSSCVLKLKAAEVGHDTPLDMAILQNALEYAKGAEADLGCASTELLDQLDIAASYHWRLCRTAFTYGEAFETSTLDLRVASMYHWSYGIEVPGVKPIGTPSTFYDLLGHVGLAHYIEAKYQAGAVIDQDVSHHLLMQAIANFGSLKSGSDVLSRSYVENFLKNGGSPNFTYFGTTPWEEALTAAATHFMIYRSLKERPTEARFSSEWEQMTRVWVDVIEAFVLHDADVNLRCQRHPRLPGHPRLAPLDVVESLSPDCVGDKSAHLKELLLQRGATRAVGTASSLHTESGITGGNVDPGRLVGNTEVSGGNRDAKTNRPILSLGWMASWFGYEI